MPAPGTDRSELGSREEAKWRLEDQTSRERILPGKLAFPSKTWNKNKNNKKKKKKKKKK
ncbi:hypothetical protein PIB30_042566, partial [Stylosanthes scabra]|nr:hypothetical protein [Stylosanthes scabra]